MLVPKLRFKREDGTDYPDWKSKQLHSIFIERNETQTITEDAPLLSFTIEQGVINPEEKKTNKRDFLIKDKDNKKYALTEYNDIIYNPANLKFGAIHRNKLGRGVVSPIYAIFQTDENPVFMEYIVTNPVFIKKSLKYLEGTVIKLMTLKPRDFLLMKCCIPCIEEQEKIADFLSTVDEVIAQSEAEAQNLEQQKKAAMQKIFSQEVRFKREDGTDYPEWENTSLGKIGDVAMCKRILKEQTSENGDVPFFKISTFGGTPDAYISYQLFDDFKQIYRFPQKGAILISAAGTIGKTVRYNGEDAYYQDSNIVWLEHDDSVVDDFLYQFYQQVSWEGLEGSTIKRLYNKNLLETPISLPCLEEQQKIADFLSAYDEAISYAKQELDKWKELKKGLLQQMFV